MRCILFTYNKMFQAMENTDSENFDQDYPLDKLRRWL